MVERLGIANVQINEADKNKDVRINFDGVYMDSRVYVNGQFVGHYPSGYNHFLMISLNF